VTSQAAHSHQWQQQAGGGTGTALMGCSKASWCPWGPFFVPGFFLSFDFFLFTRWCGASEDGGRFEF